MQTEQRTFAWMERFIIVVLGIVSLAYGVQHMNTIGVDFYHFWAVDIVLTETKREAGHPYHKVAEKYDSTMQKYAVKHGGAALESVTHYRRRGEFTASPLLYTLFSCLPQEYALALLLFQGLSVLFFAVAFFAMVGYYWGEAVNFISVCFFFILFNKFTPFSHDLVAGNINCLQLFLLVLALMPLVSLEKAKSFRGQILLGTLFLSLLAFLLLIKINFLLIAVAALLYFWQQTPGKVLLLSFVYSAFWILLLFLLPMFYFQNGKIWLDWFRFVAAGDPETLIRPVTFANYSWPLVLSIFAKISLPTATKATVGFLVFSFLGVFFFRLWRRMVPSSCSWIPGARQAFSALASNLPLLLSLATVVTMALAPLMWSHYYVVILIPALWLMRQKSSTLGALGFLSLLMCSGVLDDFYKLLAMEKILVPLSSAISFLPLWIGCLLSFYCTSFPAPAKGVTE